MFIISTKVTGKKLVIGACSLLIVMAFFLFPKGNADEVMAKNMEKRYDGMKTAADVAGFLTSFGWDVSEEPLRVEQVLIPKAFDDVYIQYNDLQQEQELDLTVAQGKKVLLYSYQVTNHPSGEEQVVANVLVYKNKIIGGDISSARVDGFIQGFNKEA